MTEGFPRATSTVDADTVRLVDGRGLAFARYGTRGGMPCFFLHGTPGSRLQPRWLLTMLPGVGDNRDALSGIELIALDRPGYGESDAVAGRRFAGIGNDVALVADHLGIDQFALLGVSGGGGHALAVAAELGDRVTCCAIVSGMAELRRDDLAAMTGQVRTLYGLARRAPWLARLVAAPLFKRQAKRLRGRDAVRALVQGLDAAAADALTARATRAFIDAFADDLDAAMASGVGALVADLRAYAVGFDFDPATIVSPVTWWHGRQDVVVPLSIARRATSRSRAATLVEFDGGHFATDAVRAAALEALLRAR